MNKETWLNRIERVARLEKQSRWVRLLHNPLTRIYGLLFAKYIFPYTKKSNYSYAHLICDCNMVVALPDGLDIYLCGCKVHDSELRLTRWLIKTLQPKDVFFDVGAHFGFFSLLAAKLVDNTGRVVCFEPAAVASNLLRNNLNPYSQARVVQAAVGEKTGTMMFVEEKQGHTEASHRMNEKDEQSEHIQGMLVNSVSLDDYSEKEKIIPRVIKIDAEGSELKVIEGMKRLMQTHRPVIIIEFWSAHFHQNQSHLEAIDVLLNAGYRLNLINDCGELFESSEPEHFCILRNLESDNLVFTP